MCCADCTALLLLSEIAKVPGGTVHPATETISRRCVNDITDDMSELKSNYRCLQKSPVFVQDLKGWLSQGQHSCHMERTIIYHHIFDSHIVMVMCRFTGRAHYLYPRELNL